MAALSNVLEKLKKDNWKSQSRQLVIRNELKEFWKRFGANLATLIVSAFGLVAALSWNDAIKDAITVLLPSEKTLYYKFYVAILVTFIAVFATYFISKLKPQN